MEDSPLTARDHPRHMRGLPGDVLEKPRCEPRTFALAFDGTREGPLDAWVATRPELATAPMRYAASWNPYA
jgi:hypothetical protein